MREFYKSLNNSHVVSHLSVKKICFTIQHYPSVTLAQTENQFFSDTQLLHKHAFNTIRASFNKTNRKGWISFILKGR